ncbi:hypothetical protein KRX19_03180 [Cardiobacteriaceae bacterium TAE3-ERU3]|nr:hypothetical protein [Cardiobacteriaceae bacterium TAE3-ERU3]
MNMQRIALITLALLALSACQVPTTTKQPEPTEQSGVYGSVGASVGVSSGLNEKHQSVGVGVSGSL